MNCILMKMQETAQRYVDILQAILQVDVTIIDADYIRVAGSGRTKNRIENMSAYGRLVKSAMENKALTIMDDPMKSGICRDCPKLSSCDNKCEIWLPLQVNDQVIGVLGFVCFEEEQRQKFRENYTVYLNFLKQFGELLESRAKEAIHEQKNLSMICLLENMLDRIDSGVLVMDRDFHISKINRTGKKLLNIRDEDAKRSVVRLLENKTGADHPDVPEKIGAGSSSISGAGASLSYSLRIGMVTYLLKGNLYNLDLGEYKKLFVFQRADLSPEEAARGEVRVPMREVDRILGVSPAVVSLRERIQTVASSVSNVLITGESGTGKELVAVALHGESSRSNHPFVAVNCASIPETLLESELFGYVKGAFSGADIRGRKGLFEAADGGTVFLDEIGDMPLLLQAKLLRVLENRTVTRLGSNDPIQIHVRLVAATNKNLEQMVREGTFREDLYYRLNVIPIMIFPLRERKEDIRIIASSFIERYSAVLNKTVHGIEGEFWERLEQYGWPGNVRELQNTIEYVLNILPYSGVLEEALLPRKFFGEEERETSVAGVPVRPLADLWENLNLADMEKELIARALSRYGTESEGKRIAAEKLGIGLATLYRKIKLYGL